MWSDPGYPDVCVYDYIGRVVLLQFIDVVVAILIRRNGGNKNDEKC